MMTASASVGKRQIQPLPGLALPHGDMMWNPHPEQPNPYLRRLGQFTREFAERASCPMISLFCGGGGLDLGLNFAGFRTLVASDLNADSVSTVVTNLPHATPLVGDATELTGARLLELAGTTSIDLVAAGPPCQSFSILGKRGAFSDPRGQLALKYFDLVAEIRPRAFLFENVPGFLTLNRGEDWKRLLEHVRRVTKYHIFQWTLDAAEFGIPQYRQRVIVVGFREDTCVREPEEMTGPGAEELAAALQGKCVPSMWALESIEGLPNHITRPHGPEVKARYVTLPHGGRDAVDHTDRIDPRVPAGTVLVGSSGGGGRPHIHPYEPRVITVREAARLQSFPDWYVFQGKMTPQYRQIGNAVPVMLAYEVGKKIMEAMQSRRKGTD